MNIHLKALLCSIFLIMSFSTTHAQDQHYLRIAKITVDKSKLTEYLAALRTQMDAALSHETGVLGYTAVQDKEHPERITIFETYASVAAYQSHIQTDHFKTYKATVANMVLALELSDVTPIAIRRKE